MLAIIKKVGSIRQIQVLGRSLKATCSSKYQKGRPHIYASVNYLSTATQNDLSTCFGGPLDGIRILDFTRILAGPFCTMILGDLGAEIIKVEKPGTGDETRSWMPPVINNESCYFVAINRNKKSVALDIKAGKQVVRDLAQNCDVLIENFIPGTMTKLGLGYEQLSKENPRLIYLTISGYGTTGPYKDRGGYDVIAASLGGLLHITGQRDGEPCKVGVAMTDLATGLYAHGAIMAALLQRNSTGRGQRIDCNLLSTQVTCLVNLASNFLNAGMEAQRWGTAHESIVPYQAFPTQDEKWITIGAGSNDLFAELCDAILRPDLKGDERYKSNSSRVQHRKELIREISSIIKSKPCDEWLQIFQKCRFPYGPVNDLEMTFKDPQVVHNKLVVDFGTCKVVGPAVSFSHSENFPRSVPPKLGQHTRSVLHNILKYSDDQINQLYEQNIIE
ncbi:Succinate--hydroxymethylglutarate CoA-transferase [Orchesella cincta]|uniref:Succinate--hydroxymethylglutarate CoA-transferase n=1 Tax=Orchesella cincta TaxID=48709 RepID=A0A1D2N8Q3_ORCCI|nr:Succinate--hydroxymethylglutarate CoA-transferase [Orchesella cincta]